MSPLQLLVSLQASFLPTTWIFMMTELQTRFRQYFSTPLRRRPFDDDYEPCMKHMQRGWIKQVQYEDLNMRQANMLFKSARNSPKLKDHSHEFVSRLQPHHSLVKYPHFEQGVVKIMSGWQQ